jgi:hypothetical protein
MLLKNSEIVQLDTALKQLDGCNQIAADGSKVFVPFKLGVKAQYAILKNKRVTEPLVADLQKLKQTMFDAIAVDGKVQSDDPAYLKFMRDFDGILADSQEVALHQFAVSELNLESNTISPSILSALMPVLTGLEEG